MLGSIVLLGSADGMKRSNSAVWTQDDISKITDDNVRQLRADHEDYKKTIRSNFAKAKNISELNGDQVYNKEEVEVLKDESKDIFAGIDELKDLKTKQELADAINRMVNAGTAPEALDSYVEDNKLNGAFDALFEKKGEPYTYGEMQDVIDEYKSRKATEGLLTKEQVEDEVKKATEGLLTKEQVEDEVKKATEGLVGKEEVQKAVDSRVRLVEANRKRADILLSAGLEYVDGISRLAIKDKTKFDLYFSLSETTSKDEGQKNREE